MKKIILAFAFCIVICETIQAQEKKVLNISEDSLDWSSFSNRIIEDKENNKVYIAFDTAKKELTIDVKITAYHSDSTRTKINKLNTLLSANKPIFIQGYTTNNKPIFNDTKECGKMFVPYNKGAYYKIGSKSHIKIHKDSLPIKLTFNNKEISLIQFDSTNTDACAAIRKYVFGFTSPAIIKDTIRYDSLFFDKINISRSPYWTIKENYFINNIPTSTKDKKIVIPNELLDTIRDKAHLSVTYNIHLKHQYFTHNFSGSIAEITVKKSNFFTWKYNFKIWHIFIPLLIIILVTMWIFRKNILEYFQKCRNNNIKKIQQDYKNNILSSSDENKISFISELLHNANNDFKQKVLNILGIKPTQSDTTENDPSSNLEIKQLQEQIEQKQQQIEQKNTEILNYKNKIKEKEDTISSWQNKKDELSTKLANSIKENKELNDQNTHLKDKGKKLSWEIDSLKFIISNKDKQIEQYQQEIKNLKSHLASISRQNMYLLQIDDVLKEINGDILAAVENVEDENLKKKLVLPLLNGVPGLDEGLTTVYKRWQDQVMKVQRNFFGKNLYEMSDDEVKTKLTVGFLKNLVQGDTFSKLTRLYMYIQADWINEILIKNKFDVDKIEHIFNRLEILFNDFGIEIIYPRLFVDKMNDQQYTFDPRYEVFKLFPINEEMRMSYSKQSDLIVDIIQIGIKIQSINYSRKAIVSIPNF